MATITITSTQNARATALVNSVGSSVASVATELNISERTLMGTVTELRKLGFVFTRESGLISVAKWGDGVEVVIATTATTTTAVAAPVSGAAPVEAAAVLNWNLYSKRQGTLITFSSTNKLGDILTAISLKLAVFSGTAATVSRKALNENNFVQINMTNVDLNEVIPVGTTFQYDIAGKQVSGG
jgi:hypothetical protein